jgi:hypothetical protein
LHDHRVQVAIFLLLASIRANLALGKTLWLEVIVRLCHHALSFFFFFAKSDRPVEVNLPILYLPGSEEFDSSIGEFTWKPLNEIGPSANINCLACYF